ncbi:MAG: DUF1772 domain-containing protein [Bacteroidota bacterium]
MEIPHLVIALAMFLCALVAGFLLAFTMIVMPGIQTLDDRGFLKSFKVMDGIIQNNHPGFMLMWAGSVLAILAAAWFGYAALEGTQQLLVFGAVALYLFGAQLPTAIVNIPLNNQLQAHDLDAMDAPALQAAREVFEARWIRWNTIRTVVTIVVVLMLLVVILPL